MTFYYSMSNPFPQVLSLKGVGLNDGDIYIGVAGQDPITHPITVYWDDAGAVPAAQPLTTTSGYIVRDGTPATVYISTVYSIKVLDKNGTQIYYAANVFDPVFQVEADLVAFEASIAATSGSGLVGFSQATHYAQGTVGLSLQRTINVKDAPFNAKGDGTTDDYAAITAAVAAINNAGGGTLVFPHGTYFVNHFKQAGPSPNGIDYFTFRNCNGLVIEGCGSTVQMVGGWTMTNDNAGASYKSNLGFWFDNCTNIAINDLHQNGGAATITKGVGVTIENTSYGFRLDGCKGVTFNNVQAEYNCTDGLINFETNVDNTICLNWRAVGCKFNNNARQGMTINQLRYMTAIGSEFVDNGYAGTFGHWAPAAGIDIEPNRTPPTVSDYTGDINFYGCTLARNLGANFVSSNAVSTPNPVRFFGCTLGELDYILGDLTVGPGSALTEFYGCDFWNCVLAANFAQAASNAAAVKVFGGQFTSVTPDQRVLLYSPGANPQTSFYVDGATFNLNSASAHSTIRIFIQASNTCDFINNRIFISGTEYTGTTSDVIAEIVGCARATGNRWNTDLATTGKFFWIVYDGTLIADEYFENPTFISPVNAAFPTPYFTRRALQSLGSYVVADLPNPSLVGNGVRSYVTDSTVGLGGHFGDAPIGGGAFGCPVVTANSVWVIG